MLDNVGLRYPHRASGTKAPRTLRPPPLLRFAVPATGGAHLCSTKYYLRFWLSSCRTSLAVSALRIMRYCPMFLCFVSAVQRTRTGKTKARGLLQAPRHTANDVVQLHFKHRQSTSKTNVPGHTDMPGSKTFDNTCGWRRWHGWYTWHISPFVFVHASCSDSMAVSYTYLPTMSIC